MITLRQLRQLPFLELAAFDGEQQHQTAAKFLKFCQTAVQTFVLSMLELISDWP